MAQDHIQERTPEQRALDGQLAWIIVGTCAVLSLMLVATLSTVACRQVSRWTAELEQRQRAEISTVEHEATDAPWSKPDGKIPVDVADAPPPPDTTRPIGEASAWIGPGDYPPSALRNGVEGRVRVTASVSPTGEPLGCAIAETSGDWALDNATCAAMLNKGRFQPRAVRSGERLYWTSPGIRWTLPRD